MIGIIDYGMGNLQSVENAIQRQGGQCQISSLPSQLEQADKLILPGVGAFGDAMALIRERGYDQLIWRAIEQGKPVLGICLGMQLLFDCSAEFGEHQGLGILPGRIVRFQTDLKVPHMGWNLLEKKKPSCLWAGLPEQAYVYFVHSYHLETEADIVIATTDYGKPIQVAVEQGNVFGLQFHPEKSGDVGLKILANFIQIEE